MLCKLEIRNGVKETPSSTKFSERSASRLAEKPSMKVNLDGMHISQGLEQKPDLRNNNDESPVWNPCTLDQSRQKVEFVMKALKRI